MKYSKGKGKKYLAVLMVCVMLVGLFPQVFSPTFAVYAVELPTEAEFSTDGGNNWTQSNFNTAITTLNNNTSGGVIRLLSDVTLEQTVFINKNITIISNGERTIKRGNNMSSDMFSVGSATVTAADNATLTLGSENGMGAGNTLTIDGGAVWSGTVDSILNRGTINTRPMSGGPLVQIFGKLFMYDGVTLQNNQVGTNGGAVRLGGYNVYAESNTSATFNMYGGEIKNVSAGADGGGVYSYDRGTTFTMSGTARITGVSTSGSGGAVCSSGKVTINGGTISRNKAVFGGAGLTIFILGTLTINGGEITGNQTHDNGNGAGIRFSSNSTVKIKGSPIIKDNIKGTSTASNLYISIFAGMEVYGVLTGAAGTIGITKDTTNNTRVASNYENYKGTNILPAPFFSDDPALELKASSLGGLELVKAKVPETTPTANFQASTMTLSNLSYGMKYSVDGGNTWKDITTSSVVISNVTAAHGIKVYKPGNGMTTINSEIQTITVTQAVTPVSTSFTVTQPNRIGGKGSMAGINSTMEYSKDNGNTWTTGGYSTITGIPGGTTYFVRTKGTGTILASNYYSITINEFIASAEATPSAVISFETEKLVGLVGYAIYKINGSGIYSDAAGQIPVSAQWFGRNISIIKPGNNSTTIDSTVQNLNIPARSTMPYPAPASMNETIMGTGDGKITNVTTAMEFSQNNTTWRDVTADEATNGISGLGAGTYYVRIKATYGRFASLITTLVIGTDKFPVTAVSISGTAKLGQTLYATVEPSNATVGYQWKANDTAVGTNAATYTLQAEDIGKNITVTATGTGRYAGTVASDPIIPTLTTMEKNITIGTTEPVRDAAIADGTNTPPTGATGPTVTWSSDDGANYASASGTFAAVTTYKTKYVYIANAGYEFDNAITGNDITVTNIGSGTKAVQLTDDNKTLTITVTWPATAVNPDIVTVNNAKTAAQNATYADMTQGAATDEAAIGNTIKAEAETAVNNNSVTVTINKISYTAAIAGTSANPSGTNGRYIFTVTLKKGEQTQTTEQKTIEIIATAFAGVTDEQAVAAAKAAIVDGAVDVAYGADQTAKTAAVQTYVNTFLTDDAAGVTAIVTYESGSNYSVAISKGGANDTKIITMTINVGADPDIAAVNNAKTAAEDINYSDMNQGAATDEAAIGNAIKAEAEAAVNDNSVTVTINKISYTAPIAGTSANPSGTNGSYVFTITASKGEQIQTTVEKAITIIATAYTGAPIVTTIEKAITIDTVAPATAEEIANGTASVPTGATAPVITWSADNGASWTASGSFAAGTVYKTKYVYTANTGYQFDSAIAAGDITVTCLGNGTKNVALTDSNKTLTLTVTWPITTMAEAVTINGTVRDESGNPVTGATVTLSPDAGSPNPTTTGNDGKYTINNVPIGSYTVTVTLPNGGGNFTKNITVPDSNMDLQQPVVPTYTVTYDGNGSDGGTAPADGTLYRKEAYARVMGKGSLARSGFSFTGWNTASDGSGTSFEANDSLAIQGNVTLYAQWRVVINAQIPIFSYSNVRGVETVTQAVYANELTVTAAVYDGGSLSYQWFKNTTNSTAGGVSVTDAVYSSYTPPTDVIGTAYYYVVVTNTLATQSGVKISTNTSGVKTVIVLGEPAAVYTVSTNPEVLSNITLDNTSATQYQNYTTNIIADTGYYLPDRITVTMGGSTLVDGVDYIYSKSSAGAGAVTVYNVTGQIAITAAGVLIPTREYTLSFNSNGADTPVDAISGNYGETISLPTPTKAGFSFAGWYRDSGFATSYISTIMGKEDITLFAKWQPITYNISGNVKDEDNANVNSASVKLMAGSRQVAQAVTDIHGDFMISGVPAGKYNLVITKGDQRITLVITVLNSNLATGSVTLPRGKKNSVLEVKQNTPDIVVDKLNDFFNSEKFTQDDRNVVDAGGTVEIKLSIEIKNESGDNAAVNADNIKTSAGGSGKAVGIFLNLTLSKIITPAGGAAEQPILIDELSDLLIIDIPLPAELQGKSEYAIYRYHDGMVQTITEVANADGEYIEVSADGKSIKLHTKKFSTYAIGYTTPPTPPDNNSDDDSDDSDDSTGVNAILPKITIVPGEGGRIDVGTDNKIATIIPDDGYAIADVIVDGKSMGLTEKFTFTDENTHKISAVFVKKTARPYYIQDGVKVFIGFSAIEGNLYKYIAPPNVTVEFMENPKNFIDNTVAWAKPGIDFVTEREIFLGIGQNRFSPNEGMTRAMFVTVIGRLYENSFGSVSGTGAFSDVDANAYYARYVGWANENGIMKGIGKNRFDPDANVTREQMAVIMYRIANLLKKTAVADITLTYPDSARISSWAIEGAKYCQETKVIEGRTGGIFAPLESATRAETSAILQRFIENMLK